MGGMAEAAPPPLPPAANGTPRVTVPAPAQGPRVINLAALAKEYVAGAAFQAAADYLRSLPQYIDDVSRDLRPDIYDEMLRTDPVIASSARMVKQSILSDGITLRPAVDDEDDPLHDDAGAVCDFCTHVASNLRTPAEEVSEDLLSGMFLGNKLAEQVYAKIEGGKYPGLWTLDRVKPKPRESVRPVVDAYGNFVAVQARIPGDGLLSVVGGGQQISDPRSVRNLLQRSKFAAFIWEPKDADPRGTSVLRPCYINWWQKLQVLGSWLQWLALCATPMLVGILSDKADAFPTQDAAGNVTGTPPNALQQLLNILIQARSGNALALPSGTKVEWLTAPGKGDQFATAVKYHDDCMTRAITLQTLATQDSEHNTRAASQVHQDTLGVGVRKARGVLGRVWTWDVWYWLVFWNFGKAKADALCPRAVLAPVEQHDRQSQLPAYASVGYQLAPSQMQAVDEELGLPQRTPEETQPPEPPQAPTAGQNAGGNGSAAGKEEAPFAWDESQHPRNRIGRFAEAAGAEVAAHVTANAGAPKKELHQSTGEVVKKALAVLKPQVRAEVDALLPRAVARLTEVTGLSEKTFRPLFRGAASLTDAILDVYRGQARELRNAIRDRPARWEPEDAARELTGTFGLPSLDRDEVADAFDDQISRIVERYKEENDPPDGLPPAEEEAAVARVSREAEQLESAVRAVLWATFNPPRTAGFAFDPDEPRDEAGKWTAGGAAPAWKAEVYRPPGGRYLGRKAEAPEDMAHSAALDLGDHARYVWHALADARDPAERRQATDAALEEFRHEADATLHDLARRLGDTPAAHAAASRSAAWLHAHLGTVAGRALDALEAAGKDREKVRAARKDLRRELSNVIDVVHARGGRVRDPLAREAAGRVLRAAGREAGFAFDPDEPREPAGEAGGGRWTSGGGGGSHLDRPFTSRQTFREFYTTVHGATEERPAAPAFHDPFRRRVDDALLGLAGPGGGRLFYTHAGGVFTIVVSRSHYAQVSSDPTGRNVTVDSSDTALRGPHARESHYVPLHPGMSDHELHYRLARALGVKVPREDRLRYEAADRVARAQERESLGREKAERAAAREARRGGRPVPPASFAHPGGEGGGHWVTIEGEHVFISGGRITKGPAALVGKDPAHLPPRSEGRPPAAPAHAQGPPAARAARVKAAFEALPTYDPEDNTRPTPFPTEPVRPYVGSHVILGAMWDSAPTQDVPLASLTAHQDDINRNSVAYAADHPGAPILVIRMGPKLYVDDGTNRAAAALLAGEHSVPARVFDYDPATRTYTPVPRGGLGAA
jgi:hypothetical protein